MHSLLGDVDYCGVLICTKNPILLFRNEGELLFGFGLRLRVLGALWYIFRLEF